MTPQVSEKLKSMEARYEELMRMVSDPAIQADQTTYRTHTKALVELQPVVEGYQLWRALDRQLAENRELADSDDAEMVALAKEEIPGLEARIERYLGVLCYRFRRAGQPLERASFVFVLGGGAGPLRPQDEAEQITDFREVPTGELAEVARNLENQPGEWAVWGGFRALVHRLVAQELVRDA